MDVENDPTELSASIESVPQKHTVDVEENAPPGIRMNTGSYRKRKAKKQIGVEMTVEDLRGKSHSTQVVKREKAAELFQ